ncbi:MAG: outer membrane protein assembly factor BamA [Desulfuromonadales bacterium]|nr:outer membrane protein assembly factor BamA [Desulfuromonadales bacterium]
MVRKAVFFLLFFLMLLPAMAAAQGWPIDEIVIQGNRRVDQSAIRAVLGVRPGAEVTLEQIDQDIRAIFRLGRFQDVQAEVQSENGRRILVYQVVERPLVRRVEFDGNKELSSDKLRPLVTVKAPEIYHPAKVAESIEAIRHAYTEEGYHSATVEPELKVGEENEATLTLRIAEGEKVLIRAIRFEGNRVFTDKELKKVMATREKWFLSWMTGRGTYNEPMLENDLEIIADHYFNQGYVQVKVRQPVVSISDDKKGMEILIAIEEGTQFRVGEIDAQGDLLPSREAVLALVKLKEGEVFSRQLLRESVLAINNSYADRGYAYVNVSPLTRIEPENQTVKIVFDIEEGIQVTIQRVRITGNTKTRDKVIRREVQVTEGDLYGASKLKETRRLIHNLGFFEEVNVTTAAAAEPELMDVTIDVKERPTGTFTVGVGYSSIDGVVAQGSVSQENFLGRALKLNVAGSFGSRSTTYQLGLTDPWFLDYNLTLGFDLYKTEREWADFTRKAIGGNIKVGVPVTTDVRAFFLYKYEEKEIIDVDPNASKYIRDQEGTSSVSSITSTLVRNTTDYRLDPSRGAVSSVAVEVAGLGGTQKFAKYGLDHRHFFPLKWDTVFSVHGYLGYIHGWGGEDTPIDERFFLGGLNTIRGFESRRVGPRIRSVATDPLTGATLVDDYEYIGGEKTAYFNFEYLVPLLKEMGLKGVVFFDTGNAWDSGEEYFSDMRYSVGTGIRWFSPLGPLRLEWGYNLDPREDEPRSRVDFSIGSFF